MSVSETEGGLPSREEVATEVASALHSGLRGEFEVYETNVVGATIYAFAEDDYGVRFGFSLEVGEVAPE
jgi:hypothetical protein